MGVGLDIALITGKQSLQVRQKEMAVISNNIARTDVKWYHRQSVDVTNNTFITTTDGYYGTGIHISTHDKYTIQLQDIFINPNGLARIFYMDSHGVIQYSTSTTDGFEHISIQLIQEKL